MLRAGFSEVDITPEIGQPMGRLFINVLRAEGIMWPLMGRVAVFDDGESCFAMIGVDLGILLAPAVAEIREAIAASTELSPEDVMITCSHTHNAPSTMRMLHDDGLGFDNLDRVKDRLAAAVAEALLARTAARLRVGTIDVPGWNVNRRPVYRSDLGEEVGTNGPTDVPAFLRFEGPVDSEMKVLLAEDESGQPIGGLVNYACHPTVMYSVPVWSADYIGPLTEALKEKYGCVFVFLQGAAGNLRPPGHGPRRVRGSEGAERMGRTLAEAASTALVNSRPVDGSTVRTARKVLRIPQRQPSTEQVELARWYLERAKPGIDQKAFTRRIHGHDYTMYNNSPAFQEWFCRELIGMWEWQWRAGTRDLAEDVEIQVLSVGDVAFAGYPAEYFTEFGLRTKAESPFAETFVAELTNGWHGYIPTLGAFAHGGYETRLGYPNRLIPEAGDRMCETALALLRSLSP